MKFEINFELCRDILESPKKMIEFGAWKSTTRLAEPSFTTEARRLAGPVCTRLLPKD